MKLDNVQSMRQQLSMLSDWIDFQKQCKQGEYKQTTLAVILENMVDGNCRARILTTITN